MNSAHRDRHHGQGKVAIHDGAEVLWQQLPKRVCLQQLFKFCKALIGLLQGSDVLTARLEGRAFASTVKLVALPFIAIEKFHLSLQPAVGLQCDR